MEEFLKYFTNIIRALHSLTKVTRSTEEQNSAAELFIRDITSKYIDPFHIKIRMRLQLYGQRKGEKWLKKPPNHLEQ